MTDSQPQTLTPVDKTAQPPQATPLRCFTGGLVAGTFALALYRMTQAIALTFASKPLHSDNVTVQNIGAAVRTLVVGMVALGAGVFSLAAFGLTALGIQLLVQRFTQPKTPSAEG